MEESQYIHKSHNVSVLIYHLVCPSKYRRVIFDREVDEYVREICLEIEKRYEIKFLEIGLDKDHAHFLVQSVPTYSAKKIVQTIKSITARELFKEYPELKKKLWGGEFWSKGYFISTVGKHGDEKMLKNYVRNQGGVSKEYEIVYHGQLKLF
jgi:REP element-mobilizing transposase RayT